MRLPWILLATTLAASPVFAKPTIYKCDVTAHGRTPEARSWLSEEVYIAVDRAAKQVAVLDKLIVYANDQKFLRVPFKTRSNGKLDLSWTLKDLPTGRNGSTSVSSRATFDDVNMRLSMTISFQDTFDQPRGSGDCIVFER
ncbi:MAG: hypothetical protein AB3N11_14030 [Arenibacterium sp.]